MQLELMHQTAVRWTDPDPKYVSLLCEAGVTSVVTSAGQAFREACKSAGIEAVAEADVQFVKPADAATVKPDRPVVLKAGLWPGIQRPDPQSAGATHSLWLDQNCSLVNYLRVTLPKVPPVLGYLPDEEAGIRPNTLMAYDALELALVDAWAAGGNYLMALEPRFREGLLKGSADALAAWRKLGRTAKWLRAQEPLFRQEPLPTVTILVDGDVSLEIATLSYRHSLSPALVPTKDAPAPDPARCRILVAAGIEPPKGDVRARILANAEAGTTLVVDGKFEGAWWRVPALKASRSDPDRNYYTLGKGQVVAYKESVDDPGMLALDVIDLLTHKLRPARIWNAHAGLVMASAAPRGGGQALLKVINYSRPTDLPVLARIYGKFRRATLLRPEAQNMELAIAPRAGGSEVSIPRLERVAVVVFA